ncbi:hypothetical protein H9Q71_005429 [Fusarium xylarioides]|nr:hypothetical protein H9Q71_005429 [Fusarium xylarioides]
MGDMVETEPMDDIAVYELHGGIGDGADMVLGFNGCLFSVSISPSNGSSSKDTLGQEDRPLQDHFIDVINKATVCQDDGEHEELVDEVFIVILDAGRPLFRQLTSSQEEKALGKSLQHYLFPPFFHFRLEAPAPTGSVSIIPINSNETNTIYTVGPASDQDFQEELEICQVLPRYTPEEVFITEVLERGARSVTAIIQVHSQDIFCKSHVRAGRLFSTSEAQELKCFSEMLKVFSPKAIRVPQLLRYIYHKDTTQILGFLQQWVPRHRLSDAVATATTEKHQTWACQIRQSIELLHKNGLV